MSQIFNALQRSEVERSGDQPGAQLEAEEVLRNAERLAASGWEDTLRKAKSSSKGTGLGASADISALPDMQLRLDPANASDPIALEERLSLLSQFKPLDIALTSDNCLVSFSEQDGPVAEAFRLLGVRLRDLRRTRPLKKMLVTSTIPQEGKSIISANLACALAGSTQQKVLLVEGDVRRPALTEMLGIQGNPGLCEWLQGESSLMNSIYRLRELGFWIMPAGVSPSNPLELLQSGKLASLLNQLAEWFDTIIIDSPPVLPLADTSVWMRHADGVLLIARQGKTEKHQLKRGLEAINREKLIGAVINSSKNLPHSDYYYHYSAKNRRN